MTEAVAVRQIRPVELKAWLSDRSRPQPLLLDVREDWEYEVCNLPGSLHVPMDAVPQRVSELDGQSDIVVICHHGGRSLRVADWLVQQGFEKVHNLVGGVDAWAREVEPSMPVY